ncbi:cytoplasmic 60S subunit biogenesis factor ZNF622-like [Artemia franciscana]|uniref:cytoplasmic 60S subunit biogenesis factor ZNF622-like n=1 Tax=Artemia franciscana TaxID=6661 RepID=UPI0032DA08E9
METMQTFTCLSCLVGFKEPGAQREHFKTDWHRYNLKRKVAELPPVSAETFRQKALAQQNALNTKKQALYCEACRKKFSCNKSFENHTQSYKHIENSKRVLEMNPGELSENDEAKSIKEEEDANQEQMPQKEVAAQQEDTYSEIEEVDSDEWDNEDEIPPDTCLFCLKQSKGPEENIRHMSISHSFFLPDYKYICDIEGLIAYLGQRVGSGKLCLWCGHKGKQFKSLQALQQHMMDKGHMRLFHEGETLIEYEDFYDYSSSYPDAAMADPDEEITDDVLIGDGYEMTLPSGAVIGHRSLFRYYRQKLNPNPRPAPQRKSLPYDISQMKALGWTNEQTSKEVIQRKIRDLNFFKRVVSTKHVQLGVKANKLQKHFRHQVLQ